MKLFQIKLNEYGWDDYSDCIIAANSREEVEEMCKNNTFPNSDDEDEESFEFEITKLQREAGYVITEVNLNEIDKPIILCSSHHAG